MKNEQQYPIDVKIGVKPVVIVPEVIPRKLGEQPVSRQQTQRRGDEAAKELRQKLTAEARVLNPAVIESRKDLEGLKADLQETDVYWVLGAGRGRAMLILELARRYLKPLIGGGGVGLPPFLRSRNLEAYVSLDNELISLMKVRKAIEQTKGLVVASRRIPSCLSSAWDLEEIETRLKMGFEFVSDEMFFDEMNQVNQEEAQELADELISGAEEVHFDRKYITKSTSMYLAAKSLMDEYGCNALAVRCCEHPFLDLEIEHETTPCLALVLMNDQGLPASCQGDISALITTMMLIYTSKKSVFIGNIGIPSQEENLISINHSVPGLKMDGIKEPRLPYSLYSFGVVDWGTAVYVDMMKGKEKEVTVARVDPLVKKLLVTKGEVIKSFPVEKHCKQMTHIKVPDAAGFLHRAYTDYGAHVTAVYGDYTHELRKLADLINIEVEFI